VTPRSLVFWLARYDVKTGARQWYHLERDEWSVHYNISPDGRLLCGDGGGSSSVANQLPNSKRLDPPGNGTWLYLFRPELFRSKGAPEKNDKLVAVGTLHAERLVDLSRHDYDLEPNGIFTPNGRWVVFRSNMHGPSHVYEVEVERRRL
jgi:oligogalacturonide lyase